MQLTLKLTLHDVFIFEKSEIIRQMQFIDFKCFNLFKIIFFHSEQQFDEFDEFERNVLSNKHQINAIISFRVKNFYIIFQSLFC